MEWDYSRCISIFKQEIALIKKISLVQDSVRQAVMAREWTDFDWKMAEINQSSEEFVLLETERVEIFGALQKELGVNFSNTNAEAVPSFHLLAVRLPSEQCRELSGLYRELKMETLKMRVMNDTFLNYLNEVKTMAGAWLEAVSPAHGGKLYTCKGRQAAGDPRSMVFNHRM